MIAAQPIINSKRFLQANRAFVKKFKLIRELAEEEDASMIKFLMYGILAYLNKHVQEGSHYYPKGGEIELDHMLNLTKVMDEIQSPPSVALYQEIVILETLLLDMLQIKPETLFIEERECLYGILMMIAEYRNHRLTVFTYQRIVNRKVRETYHSAVVADPALN